MNKFTRQIVVEMSDPILLRFHTSKEAVDNKMSLTDCPGVPGSPRSPLNPFSPLSPAEPRSPCHTLDGKSSLTGNIINKHSQPHIQKYKTHFGSRKALSRKSPRPCYALGPLFSLSQTQSSTLCVTQTFSTINTGVYEYSVNTI